MAPLLDFELLMGEDRKDIWRDLCIKDAQTTADVSLVSRDHAQDPTYFIDVHSLVLLRHDWFKVLLGGEYAEGNGGAEAPAEGSYIPRMPDETKFRRRKLVKLGVCHPALYLLVQWLYTERIPSRHESSIDTVVALFSAAEMLELDLLKTQLLNERSSWLLANKGVGHTLATRCSKNEHIFSAVTSVELALHAPLQDCYLTGFTWKLAEQTSAFDADFQRRLGLFFAGDGGRSAHAACMRERLLRFMTQCPRSVWNDEPEARSANEASMTTARGRWWTDEAAEILDARVPKPMPFIDRKAPYVFATSQYESDDEDESDDEWDSY